MRYNVLILQWHFFIVGGVETYYYRLLKWAKNLGCRVLLLLDKDGVIDENWLKLLLKANVEIFFVGGFFPFYSIKTKEHEVLDVSPDDRVINIAADYECWLRGFFLQQKFKIKSADNLLYSFHPYVIRLGGGWNAPDRNEGNSFLNKFFSKKLLAPMVGNNVIVFMDDETKNFAQEYYRSYNFDWTKSEIIHLGMEEGEDVAECDIKKKYYSDTRRILTAGRFDFPFKGYMLGTIDAFSRLSKEYPDTELLIIGSGKPEEELMVAEKISHCEPEVARKIKLLKSVPYELFSQYMKNSYAFVGIGTTLLDAAKMGVPGVIGIAYMYDDISYGLWSDTPDIVGGLYDENLAEKSSITDDLRRILEMSCEEYLQLCMKHRKLLVQSYGLQRIMEQIMGHKTSDEHQYSKLALMAYSYLHYSPIKRGIKWLLPDRVVNWIKDIRQRRREKKTMEQRKSLFRPVVLRGGVG